MVVNGSVNDPASVYVYPGAVLAGEGSLGRVTVVGRLEPGDGTGILDVGALTMATGSELALELGSASDYDRVRVGLNGGVTFQGQVKLTLSLLNGFDPADGIDSFEILQKDSPGGYTGFFTYGGFALAEGSLFSVGNQRFRITYLGGDGNDVVLTSVPEPSAGILLAAIGGGAAMRWRRRNRAVPHSR